MVYNRIKQVLLSKAESQCYILNPRSLTVYRSNKLEVHNAYNFVLGPNHMHFEDLAKYS